MTGHADGNARRVHTDHRRQWRDCLYVYPVISRRAGGLSVGVNLNPDKRCTFACVYCQIDRTVPREAYPIDLPVLRNELRQALQAVASSELWAEPRFAAVPRALRRLNDIAFSGDGEPTCLPNFDEAVRAAADAKRLAGRDDVKIVVITNATRLRSPQVARALPILDTCNGEIWAKLDAGSEERFRRVNRPAEGLTLAQIVADIAFVAAGRPVVIQTLLFRAAGEPPAASEIDAYIARLREILDAGGRISLVQLHTVARPPAERDVSALSSEELEAIAALVRAALPALAVQTFGGAAVPPQHPGAGR